MTLTRPQRLLVRSVGLGVALDFEGPGLGATADAAAFTTAMCARYGIRYQARWLAPDTGPVHRTVFCCTHPTGASDFLAAFSVITARASDLLVPMHPTLCALPPLAAIGVPTWPPSHRVRNTATSERLVEHLRAGGNVLMFPAGKVGGLVDGRVRDAPWRAGLGAVLAAGGATAVPVWIDARNSDLFYAVRSRVKRLGLLAIYAELVRTKASPVRIVVGQPIHACEREVVAATRQACDALADQEAR